MATVVRCSILSPVDGSRCRWGRGHPDEHRSSSGQVWPNTFDTLDSSPDLINNPPHYTHGAVEPIDAIEAWGLNYRLGNVVKYIARHEHKGSALRDLEKARWYLDREIAKRREAEES